MTAQLLPFCRRRLDRLVLREHAEHIAAELGISVPHLIALGIPADAYGLGMRVRLNAGEVLEFPSVFLVKRPEHLIVLTPWSGAYVIDRSMIAEFHIFPTKRDPSEPPQVNPPIGIAPPKRKRKPRRPASVIAFPKTLRTHQPSNKK